MFREDSQSEYSFYLEAAISTSKQIDEDRLTYLNKGLCVNIARCRRLLADRTATREKFVHYICHRTHLVKEKSNLFIDTYI